MVLLGLVGTRFMPAEKKLSLPYALQQHGRVMCANPEATTRDDDERPLGGRAVVTADVDDLPPGENAGTPPPGIGERGRRGSTISSAGLGRSWFGGFRILKYKKA